MPLASNHPQVNLYSLHISFANDVYAFAVDFRNDYELLPAYFGAGPHRYLAFMRRWGRFVAKSAIFGGCIRISMVYTSNEEQSENRKANSWKVGAEMALDRITGAKAVGSRVDSNQGFDLQSQGGQSEAEARAASSLAMNSEISFACSGGDPGIAQTVTDFVPSPNSGENFRKGVPPESLPGQSVFHLKDETVRHGRLSDMDG